MMLASGLDWVAGSTGTNHQAPLMSAHDGRSSRCVLLGLVVSFVGAI